MGGVNECGIPKLQFNIGECDPLEFVSMRIQDGEKLLLDYAGEAPADNYYLEREGKGYIGFYLSPSRCAWIAIGGSEEDIILQIQATEAGEPYPLPEMVHTKWFRKVKYQGVWSVGERDCITGKPINCEGTIISW